MDDEYHDWLLSFINESSTFDNVSMKISKAEPNTLNLFNRKYRLNIFEYMPKLFKIINNEKEYFFNIDILRYMSLFIDKFIEDNPHQFLYQLNIEDQRNIFKKLELLHQGKLVLFDTNDHSTCSEIFEKAKGRDHQHRICRCPFRNQITVNAQEAAAKYTFSGCLLYNMPRSDPPSGYSSSLRLPAHWP